MGVKLHMTSIRYEFGICALPEIKAKQFTFNFFLQAGDRKQRERERERGVKRGECVVVYDHPLLLTSVVYM